MPARDLQAVVVEVRRRIASHRGARKLNEENTKAALIEPVLRALGWDVEDLDEVEREYKVKRRDRPVDYALLDHRNPALFLEAKGLSEDLNDRRWASQIMGYAVVAGVVWTVLTNGDEYQIYNAHAPVPVEEKLLRSVRISDPTTKPVETLQLLSKDRLADNRLGALWRSQFIDRRVGAALYEVFSPEGMGGLVRLVGRHTKDLMPGEIMGSLTRCRPAFSFPSPELESVPARSREKAAGKESSPAAKGRKLSKAHRTPARSEVTLADLIRAGLLRTPAALHKKYKGQVLRAQVLASEEVAFDSVSYASPSQAARVAMASVIGPGRGGKLPTTNGWAFWLVAHEGKEVPLSVVRDRYGEPGPGSLRLVGEGN